MYMKFLIFHTETDKNVRKIYRRNGHKETVLRVLRNEVRGRSTAWESASREPGFFCCAGDFM
jgi:hypothetical protein